MSSADAVLWLVGSATAVAVIGYVWRMAADASARRARQQRYQSHETRPQRLTQPGALSTSMGADRAASIRRSAERAALIASRGDDPDEARNPYPEGTPEFVLWVATFHLTMTEIAEQEHMDTVIPAPAPQPDRVSPP